MILKIQSWLTTTLRAHLHLASESVCVNAVMTLATSLLLTTMESLENGVGATPLWSMRATSQASSQY